jgi:hypothetical protein
VRSSFRLPESRPRNKLKQDLGRRTPPFRQFRASGEFSTHSPGRGGEGDEKSGAAALAGARKAASVLNLKFAGVPVARRSELQIRKAH